MAKQKVRRGGHRRFGSIRILRDRSVRLSAWTLPGLLPLDFTTDEDKPANGAIWVRWRGQVIFLLHLTRRRVTSAGFSYTLSPNELREAVSLLRAAGNGIERWIVPALERLQGSDVMKAQHADAHRLIPELLESVRDLPVAEPWLRQRREIQRHWQEQLRKHPETAAEVPAPWVLPSASTRQAGPTARRQRTRKRTSLKKRI